MVTVKKDELSIAHWPIFHKLNETGFGSSNLYIKYVLRGVNFAQQLIETKGQQPLRKLRNLLNYILIKLNIIKNIFLNIMIN